jgi:hypothetical protein
MTEIEKKALERVNEVWPRGLFDLHHPYVKALRRAIEQHEAFRQEVSDAVEDWADRWTGAGDSHRYFCGLFERFIIAKPDPLVEVMNEMGFGMSKTASEEFRAALAKRGLEIREKE